MQCNGWSNEDHAQANGDESFRRPLSESIEQGEAGLSLAGRGCLCMRGQLSVVRWLSPFGQPRLRVDMRLPLPGDGLGSGWELPVWERDMGGWAWSVLELPHRKTDGRRGAISCSPSPPIDERWHEHPLSCPLKRIKISYISKIPSTLAACCLFSSCIALS